MTQTFVLTEVSGPREWTGKFGPMHSYDVAVEGTQERFEISQKPETPPPTAGQTFTGEIVDGREGYPRKLKRAQQPGGGYGPRQEDPARAKRIVRQHSQDMAIETLKLAHLRGLFPEDIDSVNDIVGAVKVLANVYDKDAGVE